MSSHIRADALKHAAVWLWPVLPINDQPLIDSFEISGNICCIRLSRGFQQSSILSYMKIMKYMSRTHRTAVHRMPVHDVPRAIPLAE